MKNKKINLLVSSFTKTFIFASALMLINLVKDLIVYFLPININTYNAAGVSNIILVVILLIVIIILSNILTEPNSINKSRKQESSKF